MAMEKAAADASAVKAARLEASALLREGGDGRRRSSRGGECGS